MTLPKWEFEYYYKEDREKFYSGHLYAPTQARACLNFQKAFPNAYMKDYPHAVSGGSDGQESIATDSLNDLAASTTYKGEQF